MIQDQYSSVYAPDRRRERDCKGKAEPKGGRGFPVGDV